MYQINLVKEKVKRNQVVAFHLIAAIILTIMGLLAFITPFSLNIYLAGENNAQFVETTWVNYLGLAVSLIGMAIIITTIFFNRKYIQNKKNLAIRVIEICCFVPILGYCIINKWYLPAVYSGAALLGIILAYYLEKKQETNRQVIIDEKGTLLKTSSKNSFWKWSEIDHFIIKHNVLTLRTTDKKLYQFIIDNHQQLPEQDIISYAQKSIEKAYPQRIHQDW